MDTDLGLKIRLTRKLADYLDGIDLRQAQEGDVVALPPSSARTLIAEGWAELVDPAPVDIAVDAPPTPSGTDEPR